MNNRDIENRLRSSYENLAPDILESILTDCSEQKGQVILMQERKNNRSIVKKIVGIAAAFVLVFGGLAGAGLYRSGHAVVSTIMLDVNPSLEICVNKNEKVVSVDALNEDAKLVIGDMDFQGSSLDVTLNALIGSMLRNGFISEAANSVLITVDGKDPAESQTMQKRLMNEINSILESDNISGAVLGQTGSDDDELKKLAEEHDMTVGRAKLIRQITEQNSMYSFEDLSSLTINELNLISESGKTKLENVSSIGTASSSAYIGEQAAREKALAHCGIRAADASYVRCELDWEDGRMVYELDFVSGGFEYEVEVDATTGSILKSDREQDDDFIREKTGSDSPSGNTGSSSGSYIGKAAAKAAALKHAGVSEAEARELSCELDRERGVSVYEVEFEAKGIEYDYVIDAASGKILSYGKEADDDHAERKPDSGSDKKSAKDSDKLIGKSAAKDAALKHAGLSADSIRGYECELETEKGKSIYEISFECSGFEYEYEIDAVSGKILKSEKERD